MAKRNKTTVTATATETTNVETIVAGQVQAAIAAIKELIVVAETAKLPKATARLNKLLTAVDRTGGVLVTRVNVSKRRALRAEKRAVRKAERKAKLLEQLSKIQAELGE